MNSEKTQNDVEKCEDGADASARKTIGAVQAAAKTVVESMEEGIDLGLRDDLEHLREMIAQARRNGVSEDRIQGILDGVRPGGPGEGETWSGILEQMWVSVWLEDPDGNRVRGDTVIIDWAIWERLNVEEILAETVQQLHDDLVMKWEIVEAIAEGRTNEVDPSEESPEDGKEATPPAVIPDAYNDCEGPTLRSLMTRSRGRLRTPYRDWESAYRQIVSAPALSFEDFMAMVDRPLSLVQDDEIGNYYHLGDYEVFHQRDGRVFLTVIEQTAEDALDYLRRYPINSDGTYSGPEPDEFTAPLIEQYVEARPKVANLNEWIVNEINRTWINRQEPREEVDQP